MAFFAAIVARIAARDPRLRTWFGGPMQFQVDATLAEVDAKASAHVTGDVTGALQAVITVRSRFVINDTPWLWRNPRGQDRPHVVNSAKDLSKKFRDDLSDSRGCEEEKKLSGQDIDAYIELRCGPCHQLDKSQFTEVLDP